ncbi:MAG: hypothetical protein RLN89_03475 [Parvibaculum sp.]
MLLSFSIDEMRPWIENGLQEAAGELAPGRVKRQTIRTLGPKYQRLFADSNSLHAVKLDLWWKSRRPERVKLGSVEGRATRIVITKPAWCDVEVRGADLEGFKLLGELEERRVMPFWWLDGFNSLEAFQKYFVPNDGDVFDGVLFTW